MRSPVLILAACASAALAISAPATSIRRLGGSRITAQQVDDTVRRLMAAGEVPGVGVSIFNDSRAVYTKAYGLRDASQKLPLTENSVMGAASLTKAAFAYMVMQLVGERRLDLDRPVQAYLPKTLPEYPAYRDLADDPRYRKITARMLLSHTSGFPNLRWLTPDRKLKIHFGPGSRYAYSGEGIQLLQLVVETITNRPIGDLMRERVFDPLHMTRTSMISEPRFEDDYASGHDEYGRSIGHPRQTVATAAGSMQTTLHDCTLFLQALMQGTGLSPALRQTMLSPQIRILSRHQFPTLDDTTTDANDAIRLSYGLGLGLYSTPYGEAFFKEGHQDGFQHYAVGFEKPKDGIVILTNSSNGEGIFKGLLESLLGNTLTPIEWEGYTPYSERPPRAPLPVHNEVKVAPALLDRLVGRYEIPPEIVLKVTRKDGHLQMQENDEAPGELFPAAELRFFSKTSDDVVTFEIDNANKVTRLVIHTGGRSIPVNRVN